MTRIVASNYILDNNNHSSLQQSSSGCVRPASCVVPLLLAVTDTSRRLPVVHRWIAVAVGDCSIRTDIRAAPEFIQFEWNDYVANGHNGTAAALARIETKAKITAADVTGSSDRDAAAEKLLSRLEGTRND